MNKKEKIKLLTIKANAKREIEATEKLINQIEKERQLDFASRIKQEIYYKRGIEYILNQIEDLLQNL